VKSPLWSRAYWQVPCIWNRTLGVSLVEHQRFDTFFFTAEFPSYDKGKEMSSILGVCILDLVAVRSMETEGLEGLGFGTLFINLGIGVFYLFKFVLQIYLGRIILLCIGISQRFDGLKYNVVSFLIFVTGTYM
jgi:hypothetical protein